jgi:hypothetical protein
MPVSMITPNTVVTASEWWNPVSTLLNTVESNLAAEVTNRTTAVAAVNTRLNSTIANTGISDLPTWKTSVDSSLASEASTRATADTTEATARAAADTAINNRLNSTIVNSGISDLPAWKVTIDSWKTSTDSVQTTQTNSINALNTAVGIPYGGSSVSTRLTALEAGPGTLSHTQDTPGTTTSTTFTATLTGGTACSLVFTAPASGKILAHNTARLLNSTADGYALCSIQIRTGAVVGSGTLVVTAADTESIRTQDKDVCSSRPRWLTGLTAGSSYNAQQLFRCVTGTATFADKNLIVHPEA